MLIRANLQVSVWNSPSLFGSDASLRNGSRSWTGVAGSSSPGVECKLLVLCLLLSLGLLGRGRVARLELGEMLPDRVIIARGQLVVADGLSGQVGLAGGGWQVGWPGGSGNKTIRLGGWGAPPGDPRPSCLVVQYMVAHWSL